MSGEMLFEEFFKIFFSYTQRSSDFYSLQFSFSNPIPHSEWFDFHLFGDLFNR